MMLALHSDDENGAHMGSTPSVPTMADFQQHTVKIRYPRGFTTEKQGSGTVTTTDIVDTDNDRRRLNGDSLTKFKSELRTGFEFGYASRVKANVKVKLQRDATDPAAQGPAVAGAAFGDGAASPPAPAAPEREAASRTAATRGLLACLRHGARAAGAAAGESSILAESLASLVTRLQHRAEAAVRNARGGCAEVATPFQAPRWRWSGGAVRAVRRRDGADQAGSRPNRRAG